ncbi:TetR/AcrR family transcriptional regulator [Faecalibaculum rodentium]|uniref:TetR/AcrR family transcriptional regulator n=2 Tax=Faecalibaculum rodentium TaxID=1702221 RepID=UPI00272CDD6A|nr:TetR/AcrR family transcriptional regulator [Faecalibaculum rodentium]
MIDYALPSGHTMKRRDLEPLILDTSLQLFREKGYDNVSVREICEACDITKPTFYKYAVTKGDLLELFFYRIAGNTDDTWDDPQIQGSWWNCLKHGFCGFLTSFLSFGTDFSMQLFIQNVLSEQDRFRVDPDFRSRMAAVIRKAQASGEILDDTEPEQLYDVIMSTMIGFCAWWILNEGSVDVMDEFLDSLQALCEVPA